MLIGYRCSGKTGVGKMLARELNREFVDTDTLIQEDAGCSIETMVSSKGWDYFRDLEKRIAKAVARENNLVIDNLPSFVIILAVFIIVLLLGVAVLIFWIAMTRLNTTRNLVEKEDEDNN